MTDPCMLYMATFTINIPPMLAYIPYMDPSWEMRIMMNTRRFPIFKDGPSDHRTRVENRRLKTWPIFVVVHDRSVRYISYEILVLVCFMYFSWRLPCQKWDTDTFDFEYFEAVGSLNEWRYPLVISQFTMEMDGFIWCLNDDCTVTARKSLKI